MKAAIYCRLSEEDRNKLNKSDDSNSIKNQKAMLTQYAMEHDWVIYDIYSDDDYTGADRNRPQFKRLLADAKDRKFDIILCKTQSRFTRELELVETYIHGLFPVWGIRFVSIVDNADTANKGNKKSRQINGLVNEWYLEDMSENIRSVLTSRRENGFHIGSFAPYGYMKDPDLKGHLIIDPEAAAIVKEIFSLFDEGVGKSAIAKRLNNRGVPNPSEYKRQKGFRYSQPEKFKSRLWSYNSVQVILNNEVYIGNLVQGKSGSISYKTKVIVPRPESEWIRVAHTHEPIISDEVWKRVQKKIATHYRPFLSTGKIYPLTGKVKCMYCGASVRVHTHRSKRYLQCHTKYISDIACKGAFMPAAELEGIIMGELKGITQELLDRNELERKAELDANLTARTEKIQIELAALERRLADYTTALKQLYMDKLKGIITPKDHDDMTREFREEKTRIEESLRRCNQSMEELEIQRRAGNNRIELIEQYISLTEFTRPMCETLIDHVEIGKRDSETGKVPVSIFWNF